MPDEDPIVPAADDAPAPEPDVDAAPPDTEGEPHPLEPGGKRFSEVYGDMKDARREAQELRERLARLEGASTVTQPPPKVEDRFYTAEELQALVDGARISPAKMADQLAWQRAELKGRAIVEQQAVEAKRQHALSEVNKYVDHLPALLNQSSPEFVRAARVAREIADELGRQPDDPIVQRRALREAFGPLDKLEQAKVTRESTRRSADTHAETASGSKADVTNKDPLKGVPQRYLDHWKKLNYTREQMIAEVPYVKRG